MPHRRIAPVYLSRCSGPAAPELVASGPHVSVPDALSRRRSRIAGQALVRPALAVQLDGLLQSVLWDALPSE